MESATTTSSSPNTNQNSSPYCNSTCKVYEINMFQNLIQGIQVSACMISDIPPIIDEASVVHQAETIANEEITRINGSCSSCNAGPFESRSQQIAHYKNHWHTYNLRRRLLGRPPVTLPEFNSKADDSSSISDSDTDCENDKIENSISPLFMAATRHCRAYFTNDDGKVFSVYRCLLHHKKEWISGDGKGEKWVEACKDLCHNKGWAVIMCAGGHFAGAIFRGESDVAIKHKAIHSYLTRRGQGKMQGTRDSKGNAPRSAGASLRRYNQEQFAQHVQEILTSWKDDLAGCSLILYRAVGPLNKACIFGSGSPLFRQDFRLRTIPFPTRRPTFKEVRRAHNILTTVEIYNSVEIFQKAFIKPDIKSNITNERNTSRKAQKGSPNKTINRAKSREEINRPTPDGIILSEDESPSIQSMAPVGWTEKLANYDSSIKSTEKINNEHESDEEKKISNNFKQINFKENNDPKKKSQKKSAKIDNHLQEKISNVESVIKEHKKISSEEKKKTTKAPIKKGPIKVPLIIKKLWESLNNGTDNFKTVVDSWDTSISIEECINFPDPIDGNTILHKAAIAEFPDIISQLLELGADPCIRNQKLQTPYCTTNHQETRIAFRLFQGLYPDKYQYAKANIPGPLTLELIQQEKEKKSAQRKVKKQKDKEKQQEKTKVNKFLELNDRQKIAAAEENRCFTCGSSIKSAPFEYEKYKFCNINCLQSHRNARPLHLSTQ